MGCRVAAELVTLASAAAAAIGEPIHSAGQAEVAGEVQLMPDHRASALLVSEPRSATSVLAVEVAAALGE